MLRRFNKLNSILLTILPALFVAGFIYAYNNIYYDLDSSPNSLVVESQSVFSSNVGIGVTSPATKFEVVGTSTMDVILGATWQGNAIGSQYGGTGQDSSAWTGLVKVTAGVWATTSIDISNESNLAVSGTLLDLTDDTLSVNEGTLNTGEICRYVTGTGLVCDQELGTEVQGYDAGLASIAGLTTGANQMLYTTGADTYSTTSLTAYARTLLAVEASLSSKRVLA